MGGSKLNDIVLLQSWLSPHAQSECLGQASSLNTCFLTFTKSFCFLVKIILGGNISKYQKNPSDVA